MLTMFITPHTSEKPSATSPSSAPCSSPYTTAWSSWLMFPASLAGPACSARSCRGPAQGGLGGVEGPHADRSPALELDHAHGLRQVLALGGELQRTEEAALVEPGQRVAHGVGVGRAGLLDGEHEGEAGGGALRAVVLGVTAAEASLERVVVVGGRAEPAVAPRAAHRPLGGAHDAFGGGTKRVGEVGGGRG